MIASEQLLYTSVRLVCPVSDTQYESGTGFFFGFFSNDNRSSVAIITNKHVVRNHDVCLINFRGRKNDGSPDLDKNHEVRFTEFAKRCIDHPDPDVDLVAIPISDVLNELEAQGKPVFVKNCADESIPTAKEMAALSPFEEILTVGFPGTLWDEVHNLPIFHHGITASPPYIDLNGKKQFLIDAAVWPGASGSPVFLYEKGSVFDERGNSFSIGFRLNLLGIVFATAVQDITGQLLLQEAPTKPSVHSGIPSNLGLCVRASKIFDFQDVMVKRGWKVPEGYKLRTSES